MGEVVALDEVRAQRLERRIGEQTAIMHPSLRWAVEGLPMAHRRTGSDDVVACGAEGTLRLAATGVALCPGCFPSTVGKPRVAT